MADDDWTRSPRIALWLGVGGLVASIAPFLLLMNWIFVPYGIAWLLSPVLGLAGTLGPVAAVTAVVVGVRAWRAIDEGDRKGAWIGAALGLVAAVVFVVAAWASIATLEGLEGLENLQNLSRLRNL